LGAAVASTEASKRSAEVASVSRKLGHRRAEMSVAKMLRWPTSELIQNSLNDGDLGSIEMTEGGQAGVDFVIAKRLFVRENGWRVRK
jgi:hypothetical protein